MFETMWAFKTRNFEVLWEIEPDEDCDLSFDETGDIAAKIASGELICFLSKVSVLYNGVEIASDYLGANIYDNPHDFRDHFGAGGKYGSYFSDMVRNAVEEARKHFLSQPHIRNVA